MFLILNIIIEANMVINSKYIGNAAIFNKCKFKSVIE